MRKETLLQDFTIQTDREIHLKRPDVVIQKKEAKETIDIVVPDIVTYCRKNLKSMNRPGNRD